MSTQKTQKLVVSTKEQQTENQGGSIVDVLGTSPLQVLKAEQERKRQDLLSKQHELRNQQKKLREEQRALTKQLKEQERESRKVYAVQLTRVRTIEKDPFYAICGFIQSDTERETKDLGFVCGEIRAVDKGFQINVSEGETVLKRHTIEGKHEGGARKQLQAMMITVALNL